MADASKMLGTPEQAGTFVSPKELTEKATGAADGHVAAGMIGGMTEQVRSLLKGYEGAPPFGTIGYVAVTGDQVALIRGKSGLVKPKIGSDVIARQPRSEVASVELDPGLQKAALRIEFVDGGWWEFEIPKIHRKAAERVVQELGGA